MDNIKTDSIDLICTKKDFIELMDDNARLCKRVAELKERLKHVKYNVTRYHEDGISIEDTLRRIFIEATPEKDE